jgi:hypothetical protein
MVMKLFEAMILYHELCDQGMIINEEIVRENEENSSL